MSAFINLLIAIISQLLMIAGDIETNPGPKHRADNKPGFDDLQFMSYTGEGGRDVHFRLMDQLRPHLRQLAIALKFPQHEIANTKSEDDPVYYLLNKWLQGANRVNDPRPVTWATLITALRVANIPAEADTLENHFVQTESVPVAMSRSAISSDEAHPDHDRQTEIPPQQEQAHSTARLPCCSSDTDGGGSSKQKDQSYFTPYPMKSPHGICLIINNKEFDENAYDPRLGAEKDEDALKEMFGTLGYQLHEGKVHENCTAEQMVTLLKKVAGSKHDSDSVVVFIGTHGEKKGVLGSDNKPVPIEKIQSIFIESKQLVGKPKIFFIQACRGTAIPEGNLVQDDGPNDEPNDDGSFILIPRDSDLFFGFATSPNTKACRSTDDGSWYVIELCKILQEHYKDKDLVSMVTAVHHRIATSKEYTKPLTKKSSYKQSPQLVSTLTGPVYFTPK